MTARFLGLRAAALLGVASFNAMLLTSAPGLSGLDEITFPITEAGIAMPMWFVILVANVLAVTAVFLVPRIQLMLFGLVISSASWTFAPSSRIPWWLFRSRSSVPVDEPAGDAVFAASAAVLSILAYLLVRNLEAYSDAQNARGVDPRLTRQDLARFAGTYMLLAAFLSIVGALLVYVFEVGVAGGDLVPTLSGTAWGVWILILCTALLGGILLLLGRGTRPQAKFTVVETKTT